MEEDSVGRLPGSLLENFMEVVSIRLLLSRLEDFLEGDKGEDSVGRLPGSRLDDFMEAVWKTSWKPSGRLHRSRLEVF
ncbi:hypothetical protein DY000_02054168 [Brassica cretica]|uniref:Uncharacterized protein n=1 Tax=Brassica cretica TaxID=69181 RepID=A0ABQ7AH72_BRACR|nr:hypothetical protein DY000_02054168 [Brassica cretica]